MAPLPKKFRKKGDNQYIFLSLDILGNAYSIPLIVFYKSMVAK